MNSVETLANIIKNSNYVVFFTGAGASTDSGLADFRGKNGLYNERKFMEYEPEEILSHDFFFLHRDIFNKYLQNLKIIILHSVYLYQNYNIIIIKHLIFYLQIS